MNPLRLSFLCPDLTLAEADRPHAVYICDLMLEIVHEAFLEHQDVSVTDPAALPAAAPDGELATYVHVVDNEGLAERFIVARRDAIAWFQIDFTQAPLAVTLHELTLDERRAEHTARDLPLPRAIEECVARLLMNHGLPEAPRFDDTMDEAQLLSLARVARLVCQSGMGASAVRELGPAARAVTRVIIRNTTPEHARELFGDDLSVFDAPLAATGRRQAATQFLREPDDPYVLCSLAQELELSGRMDEAWKLYDRAVRLQPSNLRAHVGAMGLLADVGFDGERWHDAEERAAVIAESAAAGELAGQDRGTLRAQFDTLRADAHKAGGRLDDYARLLGIEANATERARAAVRLEAQRGQFAIVAQGQLDATASDLIARQKALLSLGRLRAAAAIFEGAPDVVKRNPLARMYYAEARLAAGDLDAGLTVLHAALAAAPLGRLDTHAGRSLRIAATFELGAWEQAILAADHRGATWLAARFARDAADALPAAAASKVVRARLPVQKALPFSEAWLDPLREAIGVERAVTLDRLFVVQSQPSLTEADRLVSMWHALVTRFASEQGVPNPNNPDVAPALLYVATQAISRYLAAARKGPNPLLLAYRTIAHEAFAGARFVDVEIPELLAALSAIDRAAGPAADVDGGALGRFLVAFDRAFDAELEIGGHTGAYFAELPQVRAQHYGDEARARDLLDEEEPRAMRRLALKTGDLIALGRWQRLVPDDRDAAVVSQLLALENLPPSSGEDPPVEPVAEEAFAALDNGDTRTAQVSAAQAVAADPRAYAAWRALLIACDYRYDDDWAQPAEPGLKVASTLLEVTQGARDRDVSALRAFAMRVVEEHACSYDRPMELPGGE